MTRGSDDGSSAPPKPHPNEWYRNFNPPFIIAEQPIHRPRPLRILIVGAGASGLLAAYKAARQLQNVTYVCYEKNDDVGGTWYENRYPGVEIDSPSHSYQWSFRPNPNWSAFMSPGAEIWRYLKDWAVESGILRDVKLGHRVEAAVWNEADGVWELKGRTTDGHEFSDRGEILISCNGALNNPKWPDVTGLDNFRGTLVHSSHWPNDLDLTGKTVAVIGGSGASGVQIVPAIQPQVKKLIVYIRSRFWAVPGPGSRFTGPDGTNFAYSEALKEKFRKDPALLEQYNRDIEGDLTWVTRAYQLNTDLNEKLTSVSQYITIKAFGKDKAADFLPDFGFGCRRSSPVPEFAPRLLAPNVEIVKGAAVGFTETGIVDSNGDTKDVDVCICATSFQAFAPNFTITGRDGRDLGHQINTTGSSYLSIMNEGFPNLFYIASMNAPVSHGSFLPILEWYVRYAFKIITHVQRTSLKTIVPSAAAQEDFYIWTHQLMKRLSLSEPCHSWFKNGLDHGPAVAVWAGSRAHFYEALKEPRFEDFEVTYRSSNRFEYLGNGFTRAEGTRGADRVWYLDLLREEEKQGVEAFDINPVRPKKKSADPEIVIPKATNKRQDAKL